MLVFQLSFTLAAFTGALKSEKSNSARDLQKEADVTNEVEMLGAVTDVGGLGFRDLPNAVCKLGG